VLVASSLGPLDRGLKEVEDNKDEERDSLEVISCNSNNGQVEVEVEVENKAGTDEMMLDRYRRANSGDQWKGVALKYLYLGLALAMDVVIRLQACVRSS
jgi:hypothetical protein